MAIKNTAPPRGAKLMKKAIEAAKAPGVLGSPEPVEPASLVRKLKLPNGEPISPAMKELLAVDGAWLGIAYDDEEAEIEGASLEEVVEEHFGEEAVPAFAEAYELLGDDCVLFTTELDRPACLYVGEADEAGEYPVLSMTWVDGVAPHRWLRALRRVGGPGAGRARAREGHRRGPARVRVPTASRRDGQRRRPAGLHAPGRRGGGGRRGRGDGRRGRRRVNGGHLGAVASLLLIGLAAACGPSLNTLARDTFFHSNDCPKGQVEVTGGGGNAPYQATGCGKHASYLCHSDNGSMGCEEVGAPPSANAPAASSAVTPSSVPPSASPGAASATAGALNR